MKLEAFDLPKFATGLFASTAFDAGQVGTVVFAFSIDDASGPPLTILDWTLDELSPKTLSRLVPATAASLMSLRDDIKVLSPAPDIILIDTGGAGQPLFEQACAAGFAVEAITEKGAAKYPLLLDRVLAASYYLTCGATAIAKTALAHEILHRGVRANHLTRALRAFGTEQTQPSPLLIAVVNGILEAFTDRRLKHRAILDFAR